MTVRGINLVGYLDSVIGQGESARRFSQGLDAAGVPWAGFDLRLDVGRAASHRTTRFGTAEFPHRATALWCNPDRYAALPVGDQLVRGRYTVGRWAWEVNAVPDEWIDASRWLDEIWVISDYVADLLRPVVKVPVTVLPLPVEKTEIQTPFDRAAVGIAEDAFLFLTTFDYHSTLARKNPIGTIDAYRRAFGPANGTALLVKSVNARSCPEDERAVREAAAGRDDIHLLDAALPTAEKDALLAGCDCYVALHRAEGFGIAMAEAMTQARPVIATGYSGNLQFMSPTTSLLVDYALTAVPADAGHYPAGATWAEPNVDHASALMRSIVHDREAARGLGRIGQNAIEARHAPSVAGRAAAEAIAHAYEKLERWDRAGMPESTPTERALG